MRPSPLDVRRARAETPGCERVLHLNNAGASLMPSCVIEAVGAHLRREAEVGGYEAEAEAAPRLAEVYDHAARLLGCAPDEVAVLDSATRAWDLAAHSLPLAPGDRILTARSEYASNYIGLLQLARRTGATLEVLPDDETGQLDLAALERQLDERVKLVALTHVPTNGGLVQPAAEVGRLARSVGATVLLDACQSAGQLPLDVRELGCQLLVAAGRKYLRGPRGTGLLYVERALCARLEPIFLDLHGATWVSPERYDVNPGATRFETWESNVGAKLGLGAALAYALDFGPEPIWTRISVLGRALRERLTELPDVAVHDLGRAPCGLVSFTVAGSSPDALCARLRQKGINVSVSRRSSTLLDMQARGLPDLLRASVHYYNTEEELERFVRALGEAR